MKLIRRAGWCAAAFLAAAGGGDGRAQEIVVRKSPPAVVHRIHDPRHPAPGGPIFRPSEAGLCQTEFVIHCSAEAVTSEAHPPRLRTVSVALELKITIWLLPQSTAKIARHEEAHRTIAEAYYRTADDVARGLARDWLGQRPTLPAGPPLDEALRRMSHEIGRRYLRSVSDPAEAAQDTFDRLTAHGTNALDPARAARQAMAEQQVSAPRSPR